MLGYILFLSFVAAILVDDVLSAKRVARAGPRLTLVDFEEHFRQDALSLNIEWNQLSYGEILDAITFEVKEMKYGELNNTYKSQKKVYSRWFCNNQKKDPTQKEVNKTIPQKDIFSWNVEKGLRIGPYKLITSHRIPNIFNPEDIIPTTESDSVTTEIDFGNFRQRKTEKNVPKRYRKRSVYNFSTVKSSSDIPEQLYELNLASLEPTFADRDVFRMVDERIVVKPKTAVELNSYVTETFSEIPFEVEIEIKGQVALTVGKVERFFDLFNVFNGDEDFVRTDQGNFIFKATGDLRVVQSEEFFTNATTHFLVNAICAEEEF